MSILLGRFLKKLKKFFSARRGDRNGCVIFTVYNEQAADFTHGNLKKIAVYEFLQACASFPCSVNPYGLCGMSTFKACDQNSGANSRKIESYKPRIIPNGRRRTGAGALCRCISPKSSFTFCTRSH